MRPLTVLSFLSCALVIPAGALFAADAAVAIPKPADTLAVMERAADWQLANPATTRPVDGWVQAAGYTGIMALADISANPRYADAMLAMAEKNAWKPASRVYHADDHCVIQTYAELFFRRRDQAMLVPARERFDYILGHPKDDNLEFVGKEKNDRWAWCDSLFMGPPAWIRMWAATGNQAYLDFAVNNWWKTSAYLYDKDEHLYFRDSTYFNKKEANGKKVFWGRGNGWVIGGLVRMLELLPVNHPARPKFEQQFREMAARLIELQQPDGFWHASLLDPASYPETESSGTGFFCYGLAWGINQGLLDRATYLAPTLKAWNSLLSCAQPDGKFTYVQPVGADPKQFDPSSTEPYGVGAFLLAGSEIYRLGVLSGTPVVNVTAKNPAELHRSLETIEVDQVALAKLGHGPVAVLDGSAARVLASQALDLDQNGTAEALIFQTDIAAGDTRTFQIIPASALAAIPPVESKAHARFVPERFDDFAWESDRIAHRMYGPAVIKAEGLVSSGIDVWAKRVHRLVVDGWYKRDDYHHDNGEGMDYYKVGPTRGCGGLGVWDEAAKKLRVSGNFVTWRVLADGPIRAVFELNYDAWDVGGRKLSETKRISIDAGSNMSRFVSTFRGGNAGPLTIAVGIADHGAEGAAWEKQGADGVLAYWEPDIEKNGHIACGVVLPAAATGFAQADGNTLITSATDSAKPFVYFAGAGWSRSGDFADSAAWFSYVRDFAKRVRAPLAVTVK